MFACSMFLLFKMPQILIVNLFPPRSLNFDNNKFNVKFLYPKIMIFEEFFYHVINSKIPLRKVENINLKPDIS